MLVLSLGSALGPEEAQAAPAAAGRAGPAAVAPGHDVSYPQCGGPLPPASRFGIVGTDDGVVFSTNPCLAAEAAWAGQAGAAGPSFYANTGDPGPAYSSHWPAGQARPRDCAGGNTSACSFDYGWNAAGASFAAAVEAAGHRVAAAAHWWLDVETSNSWQTLESGYGDTAASRAMDTSALAGEAAYLRSAGVPGVGVYSTAGQWAAVTTGGTAIGRVPAWRAGAGDRSSAAAACAGQPGFTGGPVLLAQYGSGGYDADLRCG